MKKLLISILISFIPIICYAEDITKNSQIQVNNETIKKITDGNENTYISIKDREILTITNEEDIYGIYIIYEAKSSSGLLSSNNNEIKIGQNNFLHEYIDLNKKPSKNITITYDNDVKIGEIYVLSKGELPSYIEVWDTPCDEADLLLLSTHSDDEQLFFAGLMPHYLDKGAKIQVVYFTNHNDNPKRLHEQLHGLYTIGIRNYPIIGFIPDAWSETLNGALKNLNKAGYTEEDAIKFEVEMIRRFKPLVVVGHDELGEYSHGQHILNTHVLKQAIELTNSNDYDTNSINQYGLWEVSKTYLHLYKENKIVMNYDVPLELFDGKTAYEVSKEGYSKHLSQQFTWFTKWLTGVNDKGEGTKYTKASQIKKYSPCEFGLYKSTVGDDINKDDMFENLTMRKDIKKDDVKNIATPTKTDNKNTTKEYNSYLIIGTCFIAIVLLIIVLKVIKSNKKRS